MAGQSQIPSRSINVGPALVGPPADVVLTLLVAIILIAAGLWAYLAPLSFFQVVAPYPPYNQHLIHDIGAFLVGLGAAPLLAMCLRDAASVALSTNAVAATLHAIGHVEDRNLGGYATDPWLISAFGLLVVVLAARRLMRTGSPLKNR